MLLRHERIRRNQRIISGGLTGVDRAALDFAIEHGSPHGGWAPQGRLAEDGAIPAHYQLTELAEGGYRQRNKRNVADSDGTLILNLGALDGGNLATQGFAQRLHKPCLVVQMDEGDLADWAREVAAWLHQNGTQTLNVAGPRESKRPGVNALAFRLMRLRGLHLPMRDEGFNPTRLPSRSSWLHPRRA